MVTRLHEYSLLQCAILKVNPTSSESMQMLYLDIISFIYDQIMKLFVHRVQLQFHVDPLLLVDDLLDEVDSSHQRRPARP